jgi:hypothetical protein
VGKGDSDRGCAKVAFAGKRSLTHCGGKVKEATAGNSDDKHKSSLNCRSTVWGHMGGHRWNKVKISPVHTVMGLPPGLGNGVKTNQPLSHAKRHATSPPFNWQQWEPHPKVVALGITTRFNSVTYSCEINWKTIIPGAALQDPNRDGTQSLEACITDWVGWGCVRAIYGLDAGRPSMPLNELGKGDLAGRQGGSGAHKHLSVSAISGGDRSRLYLYKESVHF